MAKIRCPTSVVTACSISSGRRASWKQAANRPTRSIARSVAPSSNAPASDVTSPASKAACTQRPSTVPKSKRSGLHSVSIGASSNQCEVVAAQQLSLILSPDAHDSGRVEDGRGGCAPFPIPAHQTGRADFPHPAFRLVSLQSTRPWSQVDAPEMQHTERAEHRFPREAVGAVRGHLVTSDQEVSNPFVDVVVDGPVRRQPGAVTEVCTPASQQAIKLSAHVSPGIQVAGHQDVADLGLEPQDALLRRARAQIPVAILSVVVRAEAVAKEVEALAPGVPERRLLLVEAQPELGHHR